MSLPFPGLPESHCVSVMLRCSAAHKAHARLLDIKQILPLKVSLPLLQEIAPSFFSRLTLAFREASIFQCVRCPLDHEPGDYGDYCEQN